MMKMTRENGMAKVFTPYNRNFIAKIKTIGGAKWNGEEKCWMVPETEIDMVRTFMMDVYGETDQADDSERVTVKVTFNDDEHEDKEGITLFGKNIARAFGRDSGAKLGEDVTLLTGEITSGGSKINWRTVVEAGTVIKVRNVSKKALDVSTDYNITVEEIQEANIDRAALIAEKTKLLARLAEIEKLLA